MCQPRGRQVEVILSDKVTVMPRPVGWLPHQKGKDEGPLGGSGMRMTVSLSDVSFQAGRFTVVLDRVNMMPRPCLRRAAKKGEKSR